MRSVYTLLGIFLVLGSCVNSKSNTTDTNPDEDSIETMPQILTPADPFIKKYTGSIGEFPIEMVLVNFGMGTLEGNYQYLKNNIPIEIFGEVNLDESFTLTEFVNDKETGTFQGNFSDPLQLEGFWKGAQKKDSLPFTLEASPAFEGEPAWEGTWHLNGVYDGGILVIGNQTKNSFDFAFSVFRNSHSGVIFNTATYLAGKGSFQKNLFGEEEPCSFTFNFQDSAIHIDQSTPGFSCGFGARAHANGLFEKEQKKVVPELSVGNENAVFKTKEMHDIFKKHVGELVYESFAFNFQTMDEEKVKSPIQKPARLLTGAVIGMFTTNEAIIMLDEPSKKFWAATIMFDEKSDDFFIQYSSNENTSKETLPTQISRWVNDMPGYPVQFENSI